MRLQVSLVHLDHVSSEEEVSIIFRSRLSSLSACCLLPSPPLSSCTHIQGHIQENLEDELVQEALRKVGFILQVSFR